MSKTKTKSVEKFREGQDQRDRDLQRSIAEARKSLDDKQFEPCDLEKVTNLVEKVLTVGRT